MRRLPKALVLFSLLHIACAHSPKPPETVQVKGGLDSEAVTTFLESHFSELGRCMLEPSKHADVKIVGAVVLHLKVAANGTIADSKITHSTVGQPAFELCLAEGARAWRFPESAAATEIDYPVSFTEPLRSPDTERAHELTHDAVQQVIASHMREIQACYERQLLKNPELKGRIVMRFSLAATGAVTESAVQESTVADSATESCIVAASRTWQFPAAQSASQIEYPFEFRSIGGEKTPTPLKPARAIHEDPDAGTALVKGLLDKEIIRGVVHSHMDEVRQCYETALLKRNLAGRVVVQFRIAKTGKVESSKVETTTLKDAPTEDCIAAAIQKWQFPKPEGGGVVVVSYPFVLKTDEPKKRVLEFKW